MTEGIESCLPQSLLKNFKDRMRSQNVFFQFFCRDLRNDEKKLQLCKHLAIKSENKTITLLCYEKEEIFCHRHYVKKICEYELSKLRPDKHPTSRNTMIDFV